jgi:hypothetical protein
MKGSFLNNSGWIEQQAWRTGTAVTQTTLENKKAHRSSMGL